MKGFLIKDSNSTSTGGASALDDLTDVTITTPATNNALLYNGTEWINAPQGTTFLFSIASFSDAENSPQEIGVGEWKAIGAITFTATYSNGPATSAYVSKTGMTNLDMTGTNYIGPTTNAEAIDYPATPSTITFTLHASKSAESDTETQSVAFYNRIYWGISTKENTYLESDIEALATNAITNTKGRTVTIDATATNYLIYALPVRLGTVTFWVGGFEGGFQAPETVSVTNASGFTEDYYVYRSTNSGLGETEIEVI